MDAANYKEPLEFDAELLCSVNEENFDKEVPWKYEWRDPVEVDARAIRRAAREL